MSTQTCTCTAGVDTHASHRASCSEVVFYQDHVDHLEPINVSPKVQTLDQRASLLKLQPLPKEGIQSLAVTILDAVWT